MKNFKYAFKQVIPVMIGYLFLGAGFGILLTSNGYHVLWAVLMSLIIFAGSGQYLAVGLFISGFDILNTIILTFLVNARHIFYGISMFEKFKDMGFYKPYMIFALTDETYSLLCTVEVPKELDRKKVYFHIAWLNHFYWILGGLLGAVLGEVLTINTEGLSFIMTALFVTLLTDQWLKSKKSIPLLIGIVVTSICLFIFKYVFEQTSLFLIFSMVIIFILLTVFRKKIEGGDNYEFEQL
ncbi:MAG: AzlC family ABC transporter permease [Bacilli bacterium]